VIVEGNQVCDGVVVFAERISNVVLAIVEVNFISSMVVTHQSVVRNSWDWVILIDGPHVGGGDDAVEEVSKSGISDSGASIGIEVDGVSELLLVNGSKHSLSCSQTVPSYHNFSTWVFSFQGLDIGKNISLEGIVSSFKSLMNLAPIAPWLVVVRLNEVGIFNPVKDVRGTSESSNDTV